MACFNFRALRTGSQMRFRFNVNFFIIGSLLLFTTPVQAKVYKWVDSNGEVHFGDRTPTANHAQLLDVKSKLTKPIVMYSTSWCSHCEKAKNYLIRKGIPFVDYDVEKLPNRMREFENLGGKVYPLIIFDEDLKMHGFEESSFDKMYKQQARRQP